MADIYMDIVNGDDANGGTSFADAVKTNSRAYALSSFGDRIKLAKSQDASLVGSATWTRADKDVILSSAVTSHINKCENISEWTANTGCTVASYGAYTNKLGTVCARIDITSVSGGQKLAYATTENSDYSAYEQISFWFRTYYTSYDEGDLQIKLCSDTTGDTPVDTFDIPANGDDDNNIAVTLDKGSALGNSIQSVAIYCTKGLNSSEYLYFDNIIACKSSSSADALTLTSLISKNSASKGGAESWYPIMSIDDTTITLDTYSNNNRGLYDGFGLYYGTSETANLYKREPIKLYGMFSNYFYSSSFFGDYKNGSSGNPTIYSGGWDTSADTQNGETLISATNSEGTGINTSTDDYVKFEYIGFVNFYYGIYGSASAQYWQFDHVRLISCYYGMSSFFNSDTHSFNHLYITGADNGIRIYNSDRFYIDGNNNSRIENCGTSSFPYGIYFDNGSDMGYVANFEVLSLGLDNSNTVVDNCDFFGILPIALTDGSKIPIIKNATIEATQQTVSIDGSFLKLVNCTLNEEIYINGECEVKLNNCLLTGTTEFNFYGGINGTIYSDNHDQVAGDSKIVHYAYEFYTQSATTYSGSKAWRLNIPSSTYVREKNPVGNRIASVYCKSGEQVTVTAYFRRDHADVNSKLVCKGGQIAGVSSDVTDTLTASANTWEQLSISFTPTANGVIEITHQTYTTSNDRNLYIDNIEVS
jgi:hypothetical protein